jgi:hypothetical protein
VEGEVGYSKPVHAQWSYDVRAIARVCAAMCGKGGFDRPRFLSACGMDE